ncbi:MAG: hypothetical protein F6J86_01365 [Symploca sp. SIO1B1]|nr:hypothetical protein [Symploca sp. SIO1C2]NER92511.1 hypothetical protein [Symploca sp. SIO1B1]
MPEHHGKAGFEKIPEEAVKEGSRFQAFFGRLLPRGKVVSRNEVAEPLRKLANSMNEGQESPAGDSGIPDGYAILGQFIDHDITFDTTSSLKKVFSKVELIPNIRTPLLDLDSLYGDGPEASSYLYDRRDGHQGKFLIGNSANPMDLPRNSQGIAIIPESRNDENGIISQLQLLFMRFHNAVLEGVENEDIEIFEPVEHKDPEFEKAQRAVRRHYQWIVHKDFLPRLVDPDTLAYAEQDILSGNYESDPIWGKAPAISVEFAGAAFRFGHSLVRSRYHLNAQRQNVDLFQPPASGLPSFNHVPKENVIDWRFFFEVSGEVQPQKARKLDTLMAKEFFALPFFGPVEQASGENSLAFRNLLRGTVTLSLPNGESVAQTFGAPPIPLHQKVQNAGLSETPLWFYCLAEAEHYGGKLGPVGGRIVAMTLLKILKEDPESYLNKPGWKPNKYIADGKDTFTMADLVKFVLKQEGETESPKKEAIKFGDEFYLKSQDGKYFNGHTTENSSHGSIFFARLGQSAQVAHKFQSGNGELSHNAIVQIVSTEAGIGAKNILGAFRMDIRCYYWTYLANVLNGKMQQWKISKVDGGDSKIHYGDKVYITNLNWNQNLIPYSQSSTDYVTGKQHSSQYYWTLEKKS